MLSAILSALNNYYTPIRGHYTILSLDQLPHLIHTHALCPNYCITRSKSTGKPHFLRRTYCWNLQFEWNLKFILKRKQKEKTATTRANTGSQVSLFIYLLICGLFNDSVFSYKVALLAPLSTIPQASAVRFLNKVCWHLVEEPPHHKPRKIPDIYPCPRSHSNPRSNYSSGIKQHTPHSARPQRTTTDLLMENILVHGNSSTENRYSYILQ